jgi:hypothetical protein
VEWDGREGGPLPLNRMRKGGPLPLNRMRKGRAVGGVEGGGGKRQLGGEGVSSARLAAVHPCSRFGIMTEWVGMEGGRGERGRAVGYGGSSGGRGDCAAAI